MKRGFLEKFLDRLQRVQPGDVQSFLVDLVREKGFLETIFNAILEGVIVTGSEGRIIYINRAAAEFFGLDAGQAPGQILSELVRGMEWPPPLRGREIFSRDVEVFYPIYRMLNFYVVPLASGDDPGAPIEGQAIILRDITESRRSTEETIESERFSALTLLAAGVAHEIGNPLNSLGIHLQLLQRKVGKLTARQRAPLEESIQVARAEVARLDAIITRFLRAVRPQPIEPKPMALNPILQEALAFLQPEIRDRDLLLEVDLDAEPPLLPLDPDQIKQAFYNILRNSFQAMTAGGILRVRTGHDETHGWVSFADTGGGIPADQLQRIFEPYFSTKAEGSGLGLMIVQRIVRSHGGEIALHSDEGNGLTVTLRFPRSDRRVRFLGPPSAPPMLLPPPTTPISA